MFKNPFRKDEDQPFSKLAMYASGLPAQANQEPAQQPQQPVQYAQAATLAQPAAQQPQASSNQPPAPAPQPAAQPQPVTPVVPPMPGQPQAQQFGQPQQPQPAQPRQTTMTQNTAAQRYNQMLQQNAPQAQAVSSGLAQVIENPVTQAKKKLDAAQAEFRQKVAESGLTRDAGRTTDLINKAAALKSGQALTPEEFAELEKISKTKSTFGEGIRDTDFVALQNYVQALGEADKAKQMAALTDETGERQELLSKLVGDRGYSEGQSLFDSLLAGGVQPASQQLGDIRKELITEDVLGKQASAEQQRATAARNLEEQEIASAYKDIQDMLDAEGTGKLASQEKTIRDRVAAENLKVKETNDLIDRVFKNMGSKFGDSNDEKRLMEILGIKPNSIQARQLQGAARDPSVISKLKELNEQTATSKDELTRLNQLYKIGELVNRQGNRIVAQEGDDLGTGVNQKVELDSQKLRDSYNQVRKQVESSRKELQQNYGNESIKDYKFGKGASSKEVAGDIYNRLVTGGIVDGDITEANKVIAKANELVNKINSLYTSSGYTHQNMRGTGYYTPKVGITPGSASIEAEAIKMFRNQLPYYARQNAQKLFNDLKTRNPKEYQRILNHGKIAATVKSAASLLGTDMSKLAK